MRAWPLVLTPLVACSGEFDAFERSVLRATSVDVARSFSVAFSGDEIYGWGSNRNRQLVASSDSELLRPSGIAVLPAIIKIRAGIESVCVLDDGGELRCWGGNAFGQLGIGDRESRAPPGERVSLPAPVSDFDLFESHVCAVLVSGELWCWGKSSESQAASGRGEEDILVPGQIGLETNWSSVAVGDGHSCAVREDDALLCWGRNSDGQIGQGDDAPVRFRSPTLVDSFDGIRSLALGSAHSVVVDGDGALFVFGRSFQGRLGLGTIDRDTIVGRPTRVDNANNWLDVDAATFNTCARKDDDSIWCWGRNFESQIAGSNALFEEMPVRVGTGVEIAVGRFHVCMVDKQSVVQCVGQNSDGRVGSGDRASQDIYVRVSP